VLGLCALSFGAAYAVFFEGGFRFTRMREMLGVFRKSAGS
jgi:hypothetical protein